jgi:hypothetical protein
VLRFLAVDIVVANDDGYWTRASDYSMFQDHAGRFHVLPHDMNEAFGGGGMPFRPGGGGGPMRRPMGRPPGGEGPPDGGPDSRGMRGGPPGMQHGSPTLDPLTGLDDKRKPLRSRLLAVPALRERYLRYVRDIAKNWLDWDKLGPIVARQRALIEHEVEIDTRKLTTIEAFRRATSPDAPPSPTGAGEEPRQPTNLRGFAEERRRYLLEHPEIRALDAKDRAAPGGQGR